MADNAKGGGTLLLGRVTYDLMASYWPTPAAARDNAVVAERMNAMRKIVVSRTLFQPSWQNTTVLNGDLAGEVRALKHAFGDDIAILGSGSIVAQLALSGLIDEFQLVVAPLVLGGGRTLFDGLTAPLPMTLTGTRCFANGKVVMRYALAR